MNESSGNGAGKTGVDERGAQAVIAQLRSVLAENPDDAGARAKLEDALRTLGHGDWAERAERMVRSLKHPQLQEAAKLLAEGKIGLAERALRPYLHENPNDTSALRLMAELAERIGRHEDAERLLRRAVAVDPAYVAARYDLASLLTRELKLDEAVAQIDALLAQQPERLEFLVLKATTLERLGRNDEALAVFAHAARLHPGDASVFLKAGHVSRTVGRLDESVENYRKALAVAPTMGSAWWSLANLKANQLGGDDVREMILTLGRDDLTPDDRLHIHFALGKAIEDEGNHREAFTHYSEGNRIRRSLREYDPREIETYVDDSIRTFGGRFASRLKREAPADGVTPIFVVGMPRAGSTLVEQILATHPQVEGTAELHYVPRIAIRLGFGKPGSPYPTRLPEVLEEKIAEFGNEYRERLRSHLRLGRPMAIDKNPNNWMHLGLILLMLPEARIVDVRRNPLDCGLSNFKQHFAQGQSFSYSLEWFGRYYSTYSRMMDHWDALLPGRIHRIVYERLVDDTETEVRRLLDYLGLPYDPACLEFHRNERAVRTPSSEQVRRPINRSGIGQWRAFEPWLGQLKQALGPVLDRYPNGQETA